MQEQLRGALALGARQYRHSVEGTRPEGPVGYLLAGLRSVGCLCAAALVLAIAATPVSAAPCTNEAFRTGPSANLPNCRAYEQVTPTEKNGQQIIKVGYPSRATADGSAIEYPSFGRYANSPSGAFPNAYVARRGGEGWGITNVSPPSTPTPTPPGGAITSYDFSADLSQHVLKIPLQPLTPSASPQISNLFVRSAAGTYSLVNTDPPPVTLPAECPIPSFEVACWQFVDQYTFGGSSADFQHLLFEARANLLEGFDELFQADFANGSWQVKPVGVLPNGQPAPEGSTAGSGVSTFASTAAPNANNRVANAISADGSRVIFQANSNEGEPNEAGQLGLTQIYDRLNGTETIEISAPAPSSTPTHPGAAPATFWAASGDGDRIFFTSPAELTTPSNTGPAHEGNDLYEYNFDRPGEELRDLTATAAVPAGAQVVGVLDASQDGQYVYFVARAQLDGAEGVAGEPNLYVIHAGGPPSFIATLNEADTETWTQSAAFLESYVTPDGRHVAFTSINAIPTVNFPAGYDNVNEETATAEREVYEYSAADDELFCVSCNPSGAAPVGPGVLGGVARPEAKTFSAAVSQSTAFHQVRAVSDDGDRVFFSSPDPLAAGAAATNTKAKVYQWERPGNGGCGTQGGCMSLISGGDPTAEAVFLDASGDGSDVFFATSDPLAASDQDREPDVYDARVGGGFRPKETAPPCVSAAGCGRNAATPPSSSPAATPGFKGSGNVKRKPPRCRHGKVKRHGTCVRRHKHHKRHHHGSHKGHGKKHGGRR